MDSVIDHYFSTITSSQWRNMFAVDYAWDQFKDIPPSRVHLAFGPIFRTITTLFHGKWDATRARRLVHERMSSISTRIKAHEIGLEEGLKEARIALHEAKEITRGPDEETLHDVDDARCLVPTVAS